MTLAQSPPSTGGAADAAPPGTTPTLTPATIPQWQKRNRVLGLLAVLPALVVLGGVMLYPIGFALFLSFHRSNFVDYEWRGLGNYIDLFNDSIVRGVFLTNLKFLIAVPLVIFTALVVSVLLFERIRGWRYFRIIFFLPTVLSTAVVGIMFRSAFGYYGWVNAGVTALGGETIEFFTDANLAIFVIVLALIWSGFGYQSLLLLSGLSAINPSIFEAAMIDGAGWWRRLWSVTLPNIRRVLGFVFIINVLYTFTSLFGFIFVMTAGGPGFETTTIDYLIYLRAFSGSNIGSGAALAVLLFMVVGLLTLVQAKFFRFNEED